MNKKFAVVVMAVAMMMLCGCCLKHEWQPATCVAPETCAKCEKTRGELADHVWVDATCENPKTCSVCGLTDGAALGHTWVDADCENPKTCSTCGKTEGEALGHDWAPASFDAPKTCKVCNKSEGEAISLTTYKLNEIVPGEPYKAGLMGTYAYGAFKEGELINIRLYNFDQSVRGELPVSTDRSWCWSIRDVIAMKCIEDDCDNLALYLYDTYGNLLTAKNYSMTEYGIDFNEVYPSVTYGNENGDIRVYNLGTNETLFCYSPANSCEISEEEYNANVEKPLEFDETEWSYYEEEPVIDGYFVSTVDEEHWGFLDKDGNELMMYKDASNFNKSGYALVSDDRENYSLIYKDFTVVAKDFIKAKSASYLSYNGADLLSYTDADGNKVYLDIH